MKKLFNICLILAYCQLACAQEYNYQKTIKAGFITPFVNCQTNASYLDGYGSENRSKNSTGFGSALQYAIPMNKYIRF